MAKPVAEKITAEKITAERLIPSSGAAPAPSLDVVYTASVDNDVNEVQRSDGSLTNTFTTGDGIFQIATNDLNKIFVASRDNKVYQLASDFSIDWSTDIGDVLLRVCVSKSGLAAVSTGITNEEVVLLESDGSIRWRKFTGGGDRYEGLAFDSQEMLYAGNTSGRLKRIDPAGSGTVLWDVQAMATNANVQAMAVDPNNDDVVFGGTNDQTLYRYNTSGTEVWTYDDSNAENYVDVGIDMAEDGTAYAATGSRVTLVDSAGSRAGVFLGSNYGTSDINGLALDHKGFLYIVTGDDLTVKQIDLSDDSLKWSVSHHTGNLTDVVRVGGLIGAGFPV